MNREDKIRYIRDSRFYQLMHENLESCSERELDDLVRKIVRELQKEEVKVTDNMITNFHVFLN
jgi:predicted nucleic acid-binding OB-fold protein